MGAECPSRAGHLRLGSRTASRTHPLLALGAETLGAQPNFSAEPGEKAGLLHPLARAEGTAAPTILHVFRDDVDGLLGDHRVEPDQPLMLQLLHEVGLGQEGVGGHAALLQALHGHLRVPVVVPWGGEGLEEVTRTVGGLSDLSGRPTPPPPQSRRASLTHPHLPELAGPQPLHQLQRLPGNLPLVLPPRLLGLLGLAGAAQPRA